ncbi:hypothetical protein RI129_002000 [Pyrocoelia pectoralis]|uniref:Uncharacterized protein n=1 Tax=Pyrocoelia pectoralis TaxID=417401 RepID=A0AAN7VW49_9COLE
MPLEIKSRASDTEKHNLDITSLIFYNNKLYSASDDGKIKVWDKDLRLLDEIQAHPCSVFSITIGDNKIYSCSNDGFVKSWPLNNFHSEEIVLQEQNEIYKVNFNDGKLYVGDDSGLVRIFCKSIIVGILEIMHPIVDLLALGNIIYTARDLYVVISEIQPESKRMGTVKTIEGRSPVCVVGEKLCFPSRTGKDILVHANSKVSEFQQVAVEKDAHELIINALCGHANGAEEWLYSGGWDKTLKKWKIGSELTLLDSCPFDMSITAITIGNNGELYVGGADGHIFCVKYQ